MGMPLARLAARSLDQLVGRSPVVGQRRHRGGVRPAPCDQMAEALRQDPGLARTGRGDHPGASRRMAHGGQLVRGQIGVRWEVAHRRERPRLGVPAMHDSDPVAGVGGGEGPSVDVEGRPVRQLDVGRTRLLTRPGRRTFWPPCGRATKSNLRSGRRSEFAQTRKWRRSRENSKWGSSSYTGAVLVSRSWNSAESTPNSITTGSRPNQAWCSLVTAALGSASVSGAIERRGHRAHGSGASIPGETTTPRPSSGGPGIAIGPRYRGAVSHRHRRTDPNPWDPIRRTGERQAPP